MPHVSDVMRESFFSAAMLWMLICLCGFSAKTSISSKKRAALGISGMV